MYIKQNMGHAYHKKIQDMEELGIFKEPLKSIPKMTVTTPICIIDKYNWIIFQSTFRTEYVTIGTHIQDDLNLFDIKSIR